MSKTSTESSRGLEYLIDKISIPYYLNLYYKPYLEGLDISITDRVLEVGSVGGSITRLLSTRLCYGSVVRLESSDKWYKYLQSKLGRNPSVNLLKGDLISFSLAGEQFDKGIFHFAITDFSVGRVESLFKEVNRLLKPSGYIYIREPIQADYRSGDMFRAIEEQGFKLIKREIKDSRHVGNVIDMILRKE